MAAPVPSDRVLPDATNRIDDGYKTLVSIKDYEDLKFWEKSVGPPALNGGDPIDTTTMLNGPNYPAEKGVRTKAVRALVSLDDFTLTVSYDPVIYADLMIILNVETTLTIQFPNGGRYAFYGALVSFDPGDLSEGEHPEASVTFTVTNQDPITGQEEKPVYFPPSGT